MNKMALFFVGILLANRAGADGKPLNIVATTPDLAALASAVAGENANVRSITNGREDPHFLQARPAFIVMARDADLWIRMGMELEIGWEPVLLDSARNRGIRMGQAGHFDAASFIPVVLDVPEAGVTRAQGDVHPSGNPHYMIDPLNARAVARALSARLCRLDPLNESAYKQGLASFLVKQDEAMFGAVLLKKIASDTLWDVEATGGLDDLLSEQKAEALLGGWRGAMRKWRGKGIVTFHKSWSYFAHRFGLKVVAELEPLPGVPPSPAHLSSVIDAMKSGEVELILREPFYPERPANFVSKATGARVGVVSSYAVNPGADGYFEFMDAIIRVFNP